MKCMVCNMQTNVKSGCPVYSCFEAVSRLMSKDASTSKHKTAGMLTDRRDMTLTVSQSQQMHSSTFMS